MTLTDKQREVLEQLRKYPSGRPFREEDEKAAILELCSPEMGCLVCDPHRFGETSLFTMITDEGIAALSQ
jgi:hypothetical protein